MLLPTNAVEDKKNLKAEVKPLIGYFAGILLTTVTPPIPHTHILRKEGNVLFNYALNTFHLWLYGVGHMAKDHSDSERENLLPPHGLLVPRIKCFTFSRTVITTGYEIIHT